jgi:hypothetical protein
MGNLDESFVINFGNFSGLCVLNGMARGYAVATSMRFSAKMSILVHGIELNHKLMPSVSVCKIVNYKIWVSKAQSSPGVIVRMPIIM